MIIDVIETGSVSHKYIIDFHTETNIDKLWSIFEMEYLAPSITFKGSIVCFDRVDSIVFASDSIKICYCKNNTFGYHEIIKIPNNIL